MLDSVDFCILHAMDMCYFCLSSTFLPFFWEQNSFLILEASPSGTVGRSIAYPPNLHQCHCLRLELVRRLQPGLLQKILRKKSSVFADVSGCKDQGNLALLVVTFVPPEKRLPSNEANTRNIQIRTESWVLTFEPLISLRLMRITRGFSVSPTVRFPIFA